MVQDLSVEGTNSSLHQAKSLDDINQTNIHLYNMKRK